MPGISATYRLQFRDGFGLDEARAVLPYLARLGVSHVYASPLTTARSGSTHGYDVCAYDEIDPVLGGRAAFDRFAAALREHGLGLLLDFVPNHMAASAENPWWRSVLAAGRDSPHAGYFDIDWEATTGGTPGKVLLPVLGDHYARTLDRGELSLEFDARSGEFHVRYFDARYPLSPASRGLVMGEREDPGAAAAAASADNGRLHAILEAQHYRLAFWRMGPFALNYRRFFDIDDLVGLRVERPEVFDAVHRLVLDLIGEGAVHGLRIDHVDGLRDPGGYLRRLAAATRNASGDAAFPIFVEKILGPDEALPADWPVAGTTGYEALNLVNGVFVDPTGERALTEAYTGLTGEEGRFAREAARAKTMIVRRLFPGERDGLARRAAALARSGIETRDVAEGALREALEALLVSFPVYRSYVTDLPARGDDRGLLERVFGEADRLCPADARPALDFLRAAFLDEDATDRAAATDLVARLQQLSGPVMAKSIEDTAFYRYQRLAGLSEVGGEPDCFGVTVEAFHRIMMQGGAAHSQSLVATATHDTKFGEDVRARLDALSEIPDAWRRHATGWLAAAEAFTTQLESGPAPDRGTAYRLLQIVVGAWPADLEPGDGDGLAAYRDRIRAVALKSIREAKTRTSWTAPDEAYEAAVDGFVSAILDSGRAPALLADLHAFACRIARVGAATGLAQLLVKLAMPGSPDIYQGSELWDLSLVDPDNRRRVDFALRARLLEARAQDAPRRLVEDWRSGAVKLVVLQRALSLRRRRPDLFRYGDYLPLAVRGREAGRVLAFARVSLDEAAVVVVPRLLAGHLEGADDPLPDPGIWADTEVSLPDGLTGLAWRVATEVDRSIGAVSGIAVAQALQNLPVALLHAGR